MNFRSALGFRAIILLLILSGCAASKQAKQLNNDANSALANGDYEKALASYESIIASNKANNKETPGSIYNYAGIAAWNLQQVDKSLDYLETAKKLSASTDETFSTAAKAYKKIDNLSREISNLEEYVERYPQGKEITPVRSQLFDAYVRSENWEPGEQLWPLLDSTSHNNTQYLTGYLRIKRKLAKGEESFALAKQLLKMDKNNIEALETIAEKHYNTADDVYVKEMKAYEKNKTMKQYNKLTDALKKVNQDYKTARDYFERLYKLNPDPKYAKLLGNIYTRFENKEKANYYYRLSKKKN
ncbi:MAG: tetratricopeptide repeat protein [Bacteroidales bacterium]